MKLNKRELDVLSIFVLYNSDLEVSPYRVSMCWDGDILAPCNAHTTVKRLLDKGLVRIINHQHGFCTYMLTNLGRSYSCKAGCQKGRVYGDTEETFDTDVGACKTCNGLGVVSLPTAGPTPEITYSIPDKEKKDCARLPQCKSWCGDPACTSSSNKYSDARLTQGIHFETNSLNKKDSK